MKQHEGVVKFRLDYTPGPSLPMSTLKDLTAWRRILYMAELIGEDPLRYGGYGYGNVSMRLTSTDPSARSGFIISGTQTGALTDLTENEYAHVTACRLAENRVEATGPIKPSSESLTHATIYDLDDSVCYILHVHSPDIWRYAEWLDIPVTRKNVLYGTPEMAHEVRRLFCDTAVRERMILSMGGHEDGVVAFGHTAEEAGTVMMACLARALAMKYAGITGAGCRN